MTSCEIIDADSAIGGENSYNLFTCFKDIQADAEDERMKFQQVGYWYIGELVNVLRRGNILTSNMDPTTPYSNPILYGTSDGGLGVIVQLTDPVFKYALYPFNMFEIDSADMSRCFKRTSANRFKTAHVLIIMIIETSTMQFVLSSIRVLSMETLLRPWLTCPVKR